MSKNNKAIPEEEILRKIVVKEDGTLTVYGEKYVPVDKRFSDALVKMMKNNGAIYEDIVQVNGQDYMPKRKYEAYLKISKALYKKVRVMAYNDLSQISEKSINRFKELYAEIPVVDGKRLWGHSKKNGYGQYTVTLKSGKTNSHTSA